MTNASVNPARSTGPAVFVGGWALAQLWLFWVAPVAGAAIAGSGCRFAVGDAGSEPLAAEAPDTGTARTTVGEAASPSPGDARGAGHPEHRR